MKQMQTPVAEECKDLIYLIKKNCYIERKKNLNPTLRITPK